ncbi:MAG: M20/M25/M40 family metallo-hydrolase [Caldilineaceae bacterium]
MTTPTAHPLLTENPSLTIFADLLSVPSPSGHENRVAEKVRARLDALGYAHETDGAGNVLVRLAGQEPNAPLLCLASHMDEIGFVVTSIEKDGALRVVRSGGLFPWKLGEGPVEVLGDRGSITGVLAMGSTHTAARSTAIEWGDVRVLTGLSPAELAEAGVRPGSPGVPTRAVVGPVIFGNADDPLVGAWTFDDRMGVVALLRLLTELKERNLQPMRPTLIAFTVSEEVGGLGAKVVANRAQPETFIAVDGSPMPPGAPLQIDGRPGIWSKDRLAPYDARLLQDLMAAAERADTQLQPVAFDNAASDASLVYAAGLTQRIACVGHVRENSHGYEVARVSVFENVVRTLVEFVTTWIG